MTRTSFLKSILIGLGLGSTAIAQAQTIPFTLTPGPVTVSGGTFTLAPSVGTISTFPPKTGFALVTVTGIPSGTVIFTLAIGTAAPQTFMETFTFTARPTFMSPDAPQSINGGFHDDTVYTFDQGTQGFVQLASLNCFAQSDQYPANGTPAPSRGSFYAGTTITSAPEPSTLTVIALGAFGVPVLACKTRKKAKQ